jgi:hypothetical protein
VNDIPSLPGTGPHGEINKITTTNETINSLPIHPSSQSCRPCSPGTAANVATTSSARCARSRAQANTHLSTNEPVVRHANPNAYPSIPPRCCPRGTAADVTTTKFRTPCTLARTSTNPPLRLAVSKDTC